MKSILRVGPFLFMVALAGACMHSRVDENWGRSFEAQLAWQTVDPDAPETREPVEGMDAETAQRVAERYYEGQEQQQQRMVPLTLIGD